MPRARQFAECLKTIKEKEQSQEKKLLILRSKASYSHMIHLPKTKIKLILTAPPSGWGFQHVPSQETELPLAPGLVTHQSKKKKKITFKAAPVTNLSDQS